MFNHDVAMLINLSILPALEGDMKAGAEPISRYGYRYYLPMYVLWMKTSPSAVPKWSIKIFLPPEVMRPLILFMALNERQKQS